MINAPRLVHDLKRLLQRLEADLLERAESPDLPEVERRLRIEHAGAREAERTAQGWTEWLAGQATQVAAAWILGAVFVRFLEDNRLLDPPRLAGPGERLARARDEQELYFRAHPTETDRDYLLHVFDDLAALPVTRDLFGPHNPLRALPNWLSGDAAGELLRLLQRIDPGSGALLHDFTDPDWDTRFLGDLYQELSETARARYALLQTPRFVERFILDRTLDPAMAEFGLDGFRMIDPACGSGHFLLGSFARLLDRWQRREPGTNVRALAQRALDSVHGVDLNPYAVAIARFRLLLAAMRACGIERLAAAPAFRLNLACGDSLLHAPTRTGERFLDFELLQEETEHAYAAEDLDELKRLLQPGRYHAVVANPPYITPKDPLLNQRYRRRFATCYRLYSLAVPFGEQLFRLAARGGFVGQFTANSFMKREFGKKLVEEFLPTVDQTHVIDTSGAYLPGHGIPTVILLARNRLPVASTVRTVMGIRGEPATPEDPARGVVWSAILAQVDHPGSQSEWVSVADTPREQFHKHPWSIGGGGAADLRARLEDETSSRLEHVCQEIGFAAVTREDEAYVVSSPVARRRGINHHFIRPLVAGECVRDWIIHDPEDAIWPYNANTLVAIDSTAVLRFLWRLRAQLKSRVAYGQSQIERGLSWFEYSMLFRNRLRIPLSIVYGEIATHNHFVLDGAGSLYNRTAPVVKLPADCGETGETNHLQLLTVLNSSIGCFWLKQVCHNKGSTVDQHGARQRTAPFEDFYAFNGTKLAQFPLPAVLPSDLAAQLHKSAQQLRELSPVGRSRQNEAADFAYLPTQRSEWSHVRASMIALQEELDWDCYRLYGLLEEDLTYGEEPPPVQLGERAFEIVMARRMAAGELETTWFTRHGSTPVTEIPGHWPEAYRDLVARRIAVIERDRNIGLIERPEYKRRWNTEPWESQLERALRDWLLDRLERTFDLDGRMNDAGEPTALFPVALVSTARLADAARQDEEFMRVAALYRNDPAFDLQRLVDDLAAAESVPLLPVLRYTAAGLRKRVEWERTWDLQRREDAIDARIALPADDIHHLEPEAAAALKRREVGDIPVPPKYAGADFQESAFWRLRGKIDVPKERWVSFPHCEGPDRRPLVAWAGYDHLQLARAISAHYVAVQEREGGREDPRLAPLLAALVELLPWLKQWHNALDPEHRMRMGDYFEGFVQEEARQRGTTPEALRAWQPPPRAGRGRRAER